jgi:endonuclease YncB( thermonuclease family)
MKNRYYAQVLRVIDGDTFEALVDLGFGISQKFKVRLDGIDTPEVKTDAGKKAKEFVRQLIEGKEVTLIEGGTEKYGRALAKVELVDGRDLTRYLVEQNVGIEYHGGKKKSTFCSMLAI